MEACENNSIEGAATEKSEENNRLLNEFYEAWLRRMQKVIQTAEDIRGLAAAGESVRKYDAFIRERKNERTAARNGGPDPVSAAVMKWAENNDRKAGK